MKNNYFKYFGFGLCFIGLILIAIAIGVDLVRVGGQSGFGTKQLRLVFYGNLVILIGTSISNPRSQRYIRRWLTPGEVDTQEIIFENWQDKFITFILIAMWFGIFSGVIESSYRLMQKYVQQLIVNQSQHFIWSVPLTLTLLFLIAGFVFYLLNLAWPRWVTLQVTLFGLSVLALMNLYYVFIPNVHLIAALILATGISIQLSRILIKRQILFYNLVQSTIGWIAAIVVSIAAFMIGYYK